MSESFEPTAWRISFDHLNMRAQKQIESAVKIGRAVDDPPLAPVAIEYARWTRGRAETWNPLSIRSWMWLYRYSHARGMWWMELILLLPLYFLVRDGDVFSIVLLVVAIGFNVYFTRRSLRKAVLRATQSERANLDLIASGPWNPNPAGLRSPPTPGT